MYKVNNSEYKQEPTKTNKETKTVTESMPYSRVALNIGYKFDI
ncbi:MAG: hypothetical protein ACRCSK_07645 [Fusobacteriaceae bacterium]